MTQQETKTGRTVMGFLLALIGGFGFIMLPDRGEVICALVMMGGANMISQSTVRSYVETAAAAYRSWRAGT